jgi:hypothetical protein
MADYPYASPLSEAHSDAGHSSGHAANGGDGDDDDDSLQNGPSAFFTMAGKLVPSSRVASDVEDPYPQHPHHHRRNPWLDCPQPFTFRAPKVTRIHPPPTLTHKEAEEGATRGTEKSWEGHAQDRLGPHPAPGRRATMDQAGVYSSLLHYLKAASDMGIAQAKASGAAAVERMKAMPTDDDCFGPGRIREDGRKIHPCYLFQVKKPSESKGAWDYYNLLATVPAEEAFRPLKDGNCPLVKL